MNAEPFARHIVAAGIDEVQFIEPYLKSKALTLQADSITQANVATRVPASVARARGLAGPHEVLFGPYVGAAPRLYRCAFMNDGEIKNGKTGEFIQNAKLCLMMLKPLERGFRDLQVEIARAFKEAIASSSKAAKNVPLVLPPPSPSEKA